jgi:NADPH:quinone reductase-like Zn-dependent oxidoreductase
MPEAPSSSASKSVQDNLDGEGNTMQAVVRKRYGPPSVLTLEIRAKPKVGDEDVLVRVRAASLNADDLEYLYGKSFLTRIATGLRKPRTKGLGVDVAGQVEMVGKNVTVLHVGDEVFANMTEFGLGAFAEYVSAPARAFALMPAGMTFDEASTIPQAAVLALQGLRWGSLKVRPGDHVLINGAGGNVGPFAVQIAKHFGAEVTGVDSTAKLDMLRSIGADHVIDFTKEDFTRGVQRYDWILDVVARRSMFECGRALKPAGVYVMLGASTARLLQGAVVGPLISITGRKKMGMMWWWKPFKQEDIAFLKELISSGRIAPVIDRTYPLSELPAALTYLETGLARGKVVIAI